MLKDIIKKIDSAIPSLFPVNPERFNDPVALQTGWKKLRSARTNRATNKLVGKSPDLLAYKPSVGGIIFGSVFILIGGLAVLFYILANQGGSGITFEAAPGVSDNLIFLVLVGLVFMAVGVMLIMLATSPVAFDKTAGVFYKGRRQRRFQDTDHSKNALRFSDIHAIQLLTYLQSSSNENGPPRFYPVYEMNIVRHDGERVNVNTYMKSDRARADAAKIGTFVNIPVWDGIDG
ncbi:MAG TPA: hypothetical protein DCM45_02525 [Clostridiales bacterium]|nr:hypothetical protein [Clostridiales bacterium]